MIRINTRQDLFDWLSVNMQHTIALQALRHGEVELLGGFSHIPPYDCPGWIVRLISTFGKRFYVGIMVNNFNLFVHHLRPPLPWGHWEGGGSSNRLIFGDRPYLYRRLKRWAK